MYAIVQNGGHQVKVEPGVVITIDRMANDAGAEVAFDQVLLVAGRRRDVGLCGGAKIVGGSRPDGPDSVFKSGAAAGATPMGFAPTDARAHPT